MAGRGVHFAITEEEADELFAADEPMDVVERIERQISPEWRFETRTAWHAVHRCLTNGRLEFDDTPAHRAVLGDADISGSSRFTVSIVSPDEVRQVAAALRDVSKETMLDRYYRIDSAEYAAFGVEKSYDDFEDTWSLFRGLRALFAKVATTDRWMTFAVRY